MKNFMQMVSLSLCLILSNSKLAYAESDADFQLHILNRSWKYYGLYAYDTRNDVISALKKIDLTKESAFCITENDIEAYHWPSQSILFNSNFTERYYGGAIDIHEDFVNKFTFDQVFIIVFNGRIVYGGAIVSHMTRVIYMAPVIYEQIIRGKDSKLRYRYVIRPINDGGGLLAPGYAELDERMTKIIDIPEIRSFFKAKNKLFTNNDPDCTKDWLPTEGCRFGEIAR